MIVYHVQCRCGFRIEDDLSLVRAQALASIHDDAFYRRPYQHDALVVPAVVDVLSFAR